MSLIFIQAKSQFFFFFSNSFVHSNIGCEIIKFTFFFKILKGLMKTFWILKIIGQLHIYCSLMYTIHLKYCANNSAKMHQITQ